MVFDLLGGWFPKTTYLIVKCLPKGNIHYLVEKQQLKKFTIRRPLLSIEGGQRGMVEDHTFTIFGGILLLVQTYTFQDSRE